MKKALTTRIRQLEPRINVICECYKFRQGKQNHGESFDSYVTSLRELSKRYNFETFTDKLMIRDLIVEITTKPKIRERLLMETDLTLRKTLKVARCTESVVRESKVLENSVTACVNCVKFLSNP